MVQALGIGPVAPSCGRVAELGEATILFEAMFATRAPNHLSGLALEPHASAGAKSPRGPGNAKDWLQLALGPATKAPRDKEGCDTLVWGPH